jgi:hypothetical protein
LIIPSGYTEAQVVCAINYVANLFAPQFVFPPFTRDDVEQQARFEAVSVLSRGQFDPSFNPKKSMDERLLSWLSISVKRRLMNFKRKNMGRNSDSDKWRARANVQFFLPLDHIDDQNEPSTRVESNISDALIHSELMAIIEQNLEPEYRPAYFKLLSGVTVAKAEREKLFARLKEILDGQTEEEN